MDRAQLLEIIADDETRLALDNSEEIIRQNALVDKQFKPIISRQLDSGGKRLRPIILLLASRVAGHKIDSRHCKCAAAIELVHQASLLHDRVIDEKVANPNLLILAGDYLLAVGLSLASEVSGATAAILSGCVGDMAGGQALQLTDSYKADINNPVYQKTAGLKTASLFTAGCEIAASLNHISQPSRDELIGFGQNFGLAFQIIDDYIDHEFSSVSRQPAARQAADYIKDAKSALSSLPDSAAKQALVRLTDSYLKATLPKPS